MLIVLIDVWSIQLQRQNYGPIQLGISKNGGPAKFLWKWLSKKTWAILRDLRLRFRKEMQDKEEAERTAAYATTEEQMLSCLDEICSFCNHAVCWNILQLDSWPYFPLWLGAQIAEKTEMSAHIVRRHVVCHFDRCWMLCWRHLTQPEHNFWIF